MNESVIDPVVFNEMRELMEDALGDFIETYLDNSPRLIENITQAQSEGDLEAIFHNAHQLKGGSGSIGAMQVFQLAKQLEEKGRDGLADGMEGLIADLNSAFAQVDAELRVLL